MNPRDAFVPAHPLNVCRGIGQGLLVEIGLGLVIVLSMAMPAHCQEHERLSARGDGQPEPIAALPHPPTRGSSIDRAGRIALAGVIAVDGLTTHLALARGGREVWIPSQHEVVIQSALVSSAVVLDWGLQRMARTRPTAARNLRYALIATRAVVVASNWRQLQQQRGRK